MRSESQDATSLQGCASPGAASESRAITNIRLPYGCRPTKACAADDTRSSLSHGWLRRRDDGMWLFATDTFIAVALKVTGDNLEEGMVPYEALRAIERQEVVSQASATAWTVARDGFTEVTYDVGDRVDPDRLPDFEKVAGGVMFEDGTGMAGESFAIGHYNLKRLGKALGGQMLRFMSGGDLKPIRVLGNGLPECRGLIMPVRVRAAALDGSDR